MSALVVLCFHAMLVREAKAQQTPTVVAAPEDQQAERQTPEGTPFGESPVPRVRVQEVIIEGTTDPEEEAAAREIFGIVPGDVLDAGAIRLGLRRVYLTGPWADVQVFEEPAGQGVRLIIAVSPDVLVNEVAIESGALPASRLRAGLPLVAGDRFRPESFDALERAVLEIAAELGYPRALVRFRVEAVSPTRRRVRLQLEPGAPTVLGRLDVLGEPLLSRNEISSLLGLAVGAPFDREGLERGLARVSQLLRKRRHLAASAEIVAVTYDEERRVATVAVRLDAGPRYRVDYVGNYVISNATLHTLVDESSMSGQDSASLDNAREKIRAHYERAGFARVQVYVEDVPAYEPWKTTAERVLRFYVDEGPRVEIEEVIVEGSLERDGRSLAADVWSFVYAETPTGDLIQPLELADLEEVFGKSPGPTRRGRPLEEPDVIWRPFTWPLLVPQVERKPLYTPGLFEAARQRMLDQYRKDGFLQASITAPDLLWVDGGRRLRVRYRVNEGNQTHIAGVRFEPPPPVPIVDLLAGATLQPGAPADLYAIEQMRLSLERNLREQGYPFATVTEELKPVGTDSIDVLYRLTPGTQVTVAGIRFRGQEQTREFLLRDRMRLGVGDLYAASAVDESRQRLLRTGLFTSVNIGFLDDREGTARRVLLVDVVERPRYSIEAGAGGSLEDGPRAFSTVEVRNLFGAGVGLRGRGQINYPRALYGLYFDADDLTSPLRRFDNYPDTYRWALFTEGQFIATAEIPKLYGLPSDVRLHMDTVGLREIRPAFTLMKGSLASGIDLQPFPWLHLAPQLELETSDFDCPSLSTGQSCNEGAPGLTRRVDAGTIGQLTLHLGTTLDARDDPFRPHSGVLVSVNSDVAIGDGVLRASDSSAAGPVTSRFWKLLGTVSTYVPLAADATLALTMRAGNIFPLSPDPSTNYIPLFKRFYLGGTNSVRGYNFDALLPVDDERWPSSQRGPIFPSEQQLISLGGNFLLNGRAELRKTLVGDLEFGLFTDTGQLATEMEAASLFGFAIGAGAGLRYLTPVGPVVLDLAAKVIDGQRRLPPFDDLSRYNLHLSIGYF